MFLVLWERFGGFGGKIIRKLRSWNSNKETISIWGFSDEINTLNLFIQNKFFKLMLDHVIKCVK